MFLKVVLELSMVLALGLSDVTENNCRPGCRTRYEVRRKWADQGVSAGYWECVKWGQSIFKLCPSGTQFSEPYQTCIPSKNWEAFPYHQPPSCSNDNEDACGYIDLETCETTCPPTECEFGNVVNGVCICFDGFELNQDGMCISTGPDRYCENGEIIDDMCVCNEGFQFINEVCIELPKPNGICEGALAENMGPGPLSCSAPVCTEEAWVQNIHYPTRNPKEFFQCHSPEILKVMPCAPGTCFHYIKQVCVHPVDWINPCN